eukprot:12377103-Alexandrium_andersonii.AAC.1
MRRRVRRSMFDQRAAITARVRTAIAAAIRVRVGARQRGVDGAEVASGGATALAATCQELGLANGRHLEDASLGGLFLSRAASKECRGPAKSPGTLG